jgi:hypothetical protein
MAAIGAVSCTCVHDREEGSIPSELRERSAQWHVPGLDGYGIAVLGKGEGEFAVVAVLYSTNAGVNLWADSLQALQGTLVSITDDHGDTYTGCFLKRVGNVRKRPALMPGSGITTRGEVLIEGMTT